MSVSKAVVGLPAATHAGSMDDVGGVAVPAPLGAEQLDEGANTAHEGSEKLNEGGTKLNDGIQQLNDKVQELPDAVTKLDDGASRLQDGAQQLNDGLNTASDGADQLSNGMVTLQSGTQQLGDGATQIAGGVDKIAGFAGKITELQAALDDINANLNNVIADLDRSPIPGSKELADLARGLEEGLGLDVADGAADLGDHDVRDDALGVGRLHREDAGLDLIGDVRDDLHRVAQVFAAALLGDDRRVHLARGDVGDAREVPVEEPLVVADVEVGLGAVLGDEDLAVLERVHGARIHVEVRIELLHGDAQPARREELSQAGGRQALTQGGRNASGDEDVLRGDTRANARRGQRDSRIRADKPASTTGLQPITRRQRTPVP